jgi:hypothetical protein
MGIIVVEDWVRLLSCDFATDMISWVNAWIESCIEPGEEDAEQKVVIRLESVGVSGTSMMGAETVIFSLCLV